MMDSTPIPPTDHRARRSEQRANPALLQDILVLIHDLTSIVNNYEQECSIKRTELAALQAEEVIQGWRENGNDETSFRKIETLHKQLETRREAIMREYSETGKKITATKNRLVPARRRFGEVKWPSDPDFFLRWMTVVSIDMAGYGDFTNHLRSTQGYSQIRVLNTVIADMIRKAVKETSLLPEEVILGHTGDGALLVLDHPSKALKFADEFYKLNAIYNKRIMGENAKSYRLWFRMAAADEQVDYRQNFAGKKDAAGTVIRDAVRLESHCIPGELFVDDLCFQALTDEEQRRAETDSLVLEGKHASEHYTSVRRFRFYPCAAAMAEADGRWKQKPG